MSVEVQWTETDPETGAKRFIAASRFAGRWKFRTRAHRRDDWVDTTVVTRLMWEELLEALVRRLPRREGVTEADVAWVKARLAAKSAPPPAIDGDQRHPGSADPAS